MNNEITMKKCNRCGEIKDIGEFGKDKSQKDGHNKTCKECRNNDKKAKERQREYYIENKDKALEYQKEYYQDNKEKIQEYKQGHYQDNKEKILEYQKEYYEDNKDKILERNKEYNQEYYQDNKEKILERNKEYKQKNKEYYIKLAYKRQNLIKEQKEQGYTITKAELKRVHKIMEGKCLYCGKEVKYTQVDHIIPLSKDGLNIKENIAPCCESCNKSKGTKDIIEFLKYKEYTPTQIITIMCNLEKLKNELKKEDGQ